MLGLINHLTLTLRLNFRSLMPVIYGYLVPVLFLIGFAAVFHGVRDELGQILTITILGGACFGMPTAMVAERERGIWRRYRLLPGGVGAMIVSTLAARVVLVASGCAMQIVLAAAVYRMGWPAHPISLLIAFAFVCWAFLGLGLVIAAIAENVPAVQALGQAIFLPMILIGGIGVPLSALPHWAQIIAKFMPGEYSVQLLNAAISGAGVHISDDYGFLALTVMGMAGIAAGRTMFRWENSQRVASFAPVLLLLMGFIAVGVGKMNIENFGQARPAGTEITRDQINSITFDDLEDDNSMVTPVVNSIDGLSPSVQRWTRDFQARLAQWPPGNDADPLRNTVNLLSLCAVADLDRYQYEGEVPYAVFRQLREQIPADQLKQILALVILHPPEDVLTSGEDLGIPGQQQVADVRERTVQYAKKLLGRLLGKLG